MSDTVFPPKAAAVSMECSIGGGGGVGGGVSTTSLGGRKCEAFIMTGEMIIRTSPQRFQSKARSKSASGMGGVLSVSPAHRSNSADPNSSTVEANGSPLTNACDNGSPRRRRKRSGTADEATIVTTKEAAFFASRECVNSTGTDSMALDSAGRDFAGDNSGDDSSPSSPPPLPPHGLFTGLDNDNRSHSSHSSSPSNSETVFNNYNSHQSAYYNGNMQSIGIVDPQRSEMLAADEANANLTSPPSPPDPSQERHLPKFIPLDEDNWVASNKFRRLPPGSIPSPTDEESSVMGKTLPVGDMGLCFAEAYGDPRGGRGMGGGEIAGQVEVAFRSPIKDVDRASAARLASRLFHLTGFKRSDVARHLGKSNEFSQLVTAEYLALFDFSDLGLDAALRNFLHKFCLTGESQERERVLQQFSKRYVETNSSTFKSEDACHALTCAIMLLNTDHHGQSICRKMTLNEFLENLSGMNDGENFPRDILKPIFNSIKNEKLVWAQDQSAEDHQNSETDGQPDSSVVAGGVHNPNSSCSPSAGSGVVGSNPFLDVPDPTKAVEYKKGPVMRKCCVSADGRRTPYGKRGWRMFYAALRDQVLYLHKNVNTYGKFVQSGGVGGDSQSGQNAIRVHHCLAVRAQDYTKKQNVLRLFTADWAEYLFQCSDAKEMQGWIDTLNFVAASLSAPPLPSACGSRKKFQRPLMPASITKLNLIQQLQSHASKVKEIEEELESLRRNPPGKKAKSAVINDFNERNAFYQFELRRFKTYQYLLEARVASVGTPSLVEESIAEETSDVASPESGHKPLLPSENDGDGASSDDTNRSENGSAVDGQSSQALPTPTSPSFALVGGQSLREFTAASGPKFDEDCIPEDAHAPSPLNPQDEAPRPAVASSSSSPKHGKKKQNQNPRVKQLQPSPNKATDRYSYRAAIYGESDGAV